MGFLYVAICSASVNTDPRLCSFLRKVNLFCLIALLCCNDMENEKGPYFTWVDSVDPKIVF